MRDLQRLYFYISQCREPIQQFCLNDIDTFLYGRKRTHPGIQKEKGGFGEHILQVIDKALELNQECDEQELIECILVHDLKNCESLPLTPAQRFAIETTKGKSDYTHWRHTPYYKFVVIVWIADMWSAFINVKNL